MIWYPDTFHRVLVCLDVRIKVLINSIDNEEVINKSV